MSEERVIKTLAEAHAALAGLGCKRDAGRCETTPPSGVGALSDDEIAAHLPCRASIVKGRLRLSRVVEPPAALPNALRELPPEEPAE